MLESLVPEAIVPFFVMLVIAVEGAGKYVRGL
jgi:hypothetical protein